MIDLKQQNNLENLSLNEITKYFKSKYDTLESVINENPHTLELIFQRVKKLIGNYEGFCKYIKDNIKPTLEFYYFASKSTIFFKKGKVPSFFFLDIDNMEFPEDTVNEYYELIIENIINSISSANRNKPSSVTNDIIHQVFLNIYSSFLYYLEAGNGTKVLYDMNLRTKMKKFTNQELTTVDNLMEIEDSLGFGMVFYEFDEDDNPIREYPLNECIKIADNFSKIIGSSKVKLDKIVLCLLKTKPSCYETLLHRIIRTYELLTGEKYTNIKYLQNSIDMDNTYNEIINGYIKKLIEGTYTDDEIKHMMIELINANYEEDEIKEYIPQIEEVLLERKDKYLLLFYQALLSKKYAYDHDINISYYFYSPFLYDHGGYEESSNTIKFYLNDDKEDMKYESTIYDSMETAYHEARHAYQYQKLKNKMSFPAFLNDIERVITDLNDDEQSSDNKRYEDVYYEREARVHSVYNTIKKLKTFNDEKVKAAVLSKINPEDKSDPGLKGWKYYEIPEFLLDKSKLNGEETFIFLISKLYETYSLSDIASMRDAFETFREVIHEDGTLYTKEELFEKYNSCVEYDNLGYPTNESMNIRAFIYTMIIMYERCPEVEEFTAFGRH